LLCAQSPFSACQADPCWLPCRLFALFNGDVTMAGLKVSTCTSSEHQFRDQSRPSYPLIIFDFGCPTQSARSTWWAARLPASCHQLYQRPRNTWPPKTHDKWSDLAVGIGGSERDGPPRTEQQVVSARAGAVSAGPAFPGGISLMFWHPPKRACLQEARSRWRHRRAYHIACSAPSRRREDAPTRY